MKMKVLVVDNEKGFASILADHLKMKGIDAGSVYSGRDALAAVSDFRPDVVILDIQMPDMNGVEVLSRIRGSEPAVEVIVLTGNGSFDVGIECMQLGAFDYLMKPVDLDQLLETIESACLQKLRGR
ncbi:MAG: response regulator [Desulfobulbaceae bacterium]|nr:MAG: response regulator [Desulfobulbaceae bacterium]